MKRQIISKIVLFAAAFILLCGTAGASYLEREFILISDKYVNALKNAGFSMPVNIAIIPFSSSDSVLQQRHIGIGIAELMIKEFTRGKSDSVVVIERSQLDKVLAEQKLSLLGMTDQSNDEKVGKLLGVKALIVGTVEKEGDLYIIESRIINAETSEVLASYKTKFAVDNFDRKASDYIIPRREATALYFGYQYYNLTPISGTVTAGSLSFSNIKKVFDLMPNVCIGGRAFLTDNIMLDLSVGSEVNLMGNEQTLFTADVSNGSVLHEQMSDDSDVTLTLSLYWVQPIIPEIDVFLGAGFESWTFLDFASLSYTTINIGIEVRPARWVGFGITVKYITTQPTLVTKEFNNYGEAIPLMEFSKITFLPTVSFHF